MKCPHCSDLLKQYRHCQQPVDMCDCCGGIWFDPGELPSAASYLLRHQPSQVPPAKSDLDRQRQDPSRVREPRKRCPKCGLEMQKLNYLYDSNIILDKCPTCEGLWADGGEFKKIVSHSKGNPLIDSLGRTVLKKGELLKREKAELDDPVVEFGNSLSQPAGPLVFSPRFIFPLKDDLPTNIIPFGTLGLILLNTLSFFLILFFTENQYGLFMEYGLIPFKISSGQGYLSFISSIFMHGDLFHLFGNMFFLWIFADNVEEHLGLGQFLAFFLICGFWADILHVLINSNSTIPTIGASGAVAGIMGAYVYLFPQAKIKTWMGNRIIEIPAFLYLGFWIAFQCLQAIFATFAYQPSVAFSAHIGGFFSGIFFLWLYEKKLKPNAALPRMKR